MTRPAQLSPTGVPGLDNVLGGGLPAGELVFLVGTPGAGKTVLGSQILYQAIRRGASALILTTFSEGHASLLKHLRSFTFFDEGVVGSQLILLSLQTLIDAAPHAASDPLAQAIRRSGAQVVLIDGFQAVLDALPDAIAVRRLLASLATLVTYLDITLLITLAGAGRDPAIWAALTTADLVLGLEYGVVGVRHTRQLEVIKQRGRAPLDGLHAYTITADGISIFPRLEARCLPDVRPPATERAGFGLPELDALLNGGLTPGTTTVLVGAPGTGKTTLGLSWALAAAEPHTATVFVTFGERPEQVRTKAAAVGLELDAAIAAGALSVLYLSPVELTPDIVATRILATLTATTRRVVIDDITRLLLELGPRVKDYLTALTDQLAAGGITSLFLLEIEPFTGLHFDVPLLSIPISPVADNVMIVQQTTIAEQLYRVLAVLKMSFSSYDATLREVVFAQDGVRVVPRAETAPPLLQAMGALTAGRPASDAGSGAQNEQTS